MMRYNNRRSLLTLLGNIGNAKIAGMMEDLDLAGWQYNAALTVFFVPYVLFEIPSNMVLKIIRPSRWIAIMIVSWGTVRSQPHPILLKSRCHY